MSLSLENNNEQINKNKWYLMLCQIHHPELHGKTDDSDPYIENHYLVYDRFEPKSGISYTFLDDYEEIDTDDEYESDEDDDIDNSYRILNINDIQTFLRQNYLNSNELDKFGKHPTIRNYHNIISKPNYIKPEIGEYIILPTQEAIAILKTFWLRIIQRKWKKIFKERNNILNHRSCPSAIYIREKTGKWPNNCKYLPELKGMLYKLNNK